MKEITTLKSDSEFKEFLEGFRKDADQERLVRHDVDKLNEMFRRQTRHDREEEMKGEQHERADVRY